MAKEHPLGKALKDTMIKDVPSYGNKFVYSLGFLSMISFLMLIMSGVLMTFYGSTWWLTNGIGKYTRSVHLWSTQAFVLFIVLHLLIVFFTSGFKKPRRLTWMIGVLMMFLVLAETEFGYVLRGDYSSQWRALQGADFYNGSGLGGLLNPLNYKQIYGVHIMIVPLMIIGLLFFHYLLVRVLGIAKPYKKDVIVKTVPASHNLLFVRGGVLIGLIVALALFLPSPYLKPTTIQSVAEADPFLVGKTLLAEYSSTSDTATYLDNINPYAYNMRSVYIEEPYARYVQAVPNTKDALTIFNGESQSLQASQLQAATDYFAQDDAGTSKPPVSPLMTVFDSLTHMAQAGLYESTLASSNETTYVTRFLADTGVLEEKATDLKITTDQYGMIREESGHAPGAWWLTPIGVLNHTVLSGDDNGDRDAAIIFGSLLLTMLAFPFIPFVNQIPDKLKVYKLIWKEKR
jgi:Cytochrome b(N-terminal)/b6/petB